MSRLKYIPLALLLVSCISPKRMEEVKREKAIEYWKSLKAQDRISLIDKLLEETHYPSNPLLENYFRMIHNYLQQNIRE
jgi:hypothetical protein